MTLSCLIIDDEAIARRGLEKYVRQIGFLKLQASCANASLANDQLTQQQVDLIFLDIQMPQLTGIEFIKSLTRPPMVVIVTAFPDYALAGFELDVIDYLVKPVSFERFLKACNKVKDYFTLSNKPSFNGNFFFVKADNRLEKIEIDKILFIEAVENYSNIYTTTKKHMTLLSIKALEEQLSTYPFLRVHRSYVVPLDKVESLEGNEITISSYKIPISRQLKTEVVNKIIGGKYLKR